MNAKIPEFYKTAIYNTFHDVVDITYPACCGYQNTVLFVKTTNGDYVTKFNTRDMVLKNYNVSHMARDNGILMPDIKIGQYDNLYFETYRLIPDKTLFERINDGIQMHAIKRAFDEILIQFAHMDNLPIKTLSKQKCINVHETTYEHVKNTNGTAMAYTLMAIVYMTNRGKQNDIGLYHSDISPKNVTVDENGKLISFLDVDSMAICNRNFAFAALADQWHRLGFNMNELYEKYEHLSDHKINRRRINTMLNAIHLAKSIMHHTGRHKIK